MEEKLLRYRQAKKKEEITRLKRIGGEKFNTCDGGDEAIDNEEKKKGGDVNIDKELKAAGYPYLKYAIRMLWLSTWALFIWLEFGLVFTALSLIILVYLNTRTGDESNTKQPSAYSVFNEGCHPIEGSIDQNQLDRAFRGQL